jgi:transcriptional regulator GlxA family with amidase domain
MYGHLPLRFSTLSGMSSFPSEGQRAEGGRSVRARHVAVLILPNVHLLDLSGPVQALFEANGFGADYRLTYCGVATEVTSAQGLVLGRLEPLPDPRSLDLVLVPGMDSRTLKDVRSVPVAWLREAQTLGARVASICSGAFALGHAGLLDGRSCTTHWKIADLLQTWHPTARVLLDRLFVRDGNVITSAGVASGIDMALSLIQEDHGPVMVARVAREMVIYLRREGEQKQSSVFLEYRTHLDHGVHKVQDWIIMNPGERTTLDGLARLAAMSPRSLTRAFRRATGITVKSFTQRVKLEVAANMLQDPEASVENVASHCGFMDARQLRRIWKEEYGVSPSRWKVKRRGSPTRPV